MKILPESSSQDFQANFLYYSLTAKPCLWLLLCLVEMLNLLGMWWWGGLQSDSWLSSSHLHRHLPCRVVQWWCCIISQRSSCMKLSMLNGNFLLSQRAASSSTSIQLSPSGPVKSQEKSGVIEEHVEDECVCVFWNNRETAAVAFTFMQPPSAFTPQWRYFM